MTRTEALEDVIRQVEPKQIAAAIVAQSPEWAAHKKLCHRPELVGAEPLKEAQRLQSLQQDRDAKTLQEALTTDNNPVAQGEKAKQDVALAHKQTHQQIAPLGRGSANDYLGNASSFGNPPSGNTSNEYFHADAFGGQCACGETITTTMNNTTSLNAEKTDVNVQPYGVSATGDKQTATTLYGGNKADPATINTGAYVGVQTSKKPQGTYTPQ